ncbi:hypothetical protein NE865_10792 [Phthorimaea operculella]|nr:hypothetical protein NE865_10792 [Phthorimaea operculella]
MSRRREKCFVPNCPNSGSKTKDKVFFFVNEHLKRKWCKQLNIEFNAKRQLVCCEDHLDLNEDLENYYQWKFMKARPRLKPTATLKYSLENVPNQPKPTETYRNQSYDGGAEIATSTSSQLRELLLQPTGNIPKSSKKPPSAPSLLHQHVLAVWMSYRLM